MKVTVRVGVLQMCSGADIVENIRWIEQHAADAAKKGVHLLCLPEVCLGIAARRVGTADTAPESWGTAIEQGVRSLEEVARSNGIWISVGGVPLPASGEDRPQNTHLLLDSCGRVVARYGKIHLFDSSVDGGYRESSSVAPGHEVVVAYDAPVPGCNLGLSVCYDVRFPELYARLAEKNANLLLIPAAFMPSTGRAHWEVLLRARAIDQNTYVVAAAQTGVHHPSLGSQSRRSYGHSLVVDPSGAVILDAPDDQLGLWVVDLQL